MSYTPICIDKPSFMKYRLSDYLPEYYSPFYYKAGEPNSLSDMENRVRMDRPIPLSYYTKDRINIQAGGVITFSGTRMLSEVAEEEWCIYDDCYMMEYLSMHENTRRWYEDDY